MKWTLIFFFSVIGLSCFSQIGVNKSHDLGQVAAGFNSIELSGDTIIVYGSALEIGEGYFGMLVAKIDTFGTVIDFKIFNDGLGDDFTTTYPNSLIKLSGNNGYVGVGQFFKRTNGYFVQIDNSGSVVLLREFDDPNSLVDFYKEIRELEDGYLIFGDKQDKITYALNTFVMKTDFEGNKIWEKKFATPGRRTLFSTVLILNENEYVIAGSTTIVQGVPLQQMLNTSKIFAVDSLGNIKWQWESQPSLEELGAGSLFKTPEGHWAYNSARGWYNAMYNEISVQPKFIIRDENFDIIRDDTFGVADFPINGLHKGLQLADGGWLLIGVKPVIYPIPPNPTEYNALSGWMVRLDKTGDQLWSRVDTAFWSSTTGSTNYYYDAVELPSGSLVVCGYSRTYDPVLKDWGWIVKVSKDGCMDTLLCTPISQAQSALLDNRINLYPNPTHSILNIESEGIEFWDKIEVINTSGQVVKQMNKTRENRIDLSGLDDGVYFLRFTKESRFLVKKVVKG